MTQPERGTPSQEQSAWVYRDQCWHYFLPGRCAPICGMRRSEVVLPRSPVLAKALSARTDVPTTGRICRPCLNRYEEKQQ